MNLNGKVGEKKTERNRGRVTIIRIYYVKEKAIFNKRGKQMLPLTRLIPMCQATSPQDLPIEDQPHKNHSRRRYINPTKEKEKIRMKAILARKGL